MPTRPRPQSLSVPIPDPDTLRIIDIYARRRDLDRHTATEHLITYGARAWYRAFTAGLQSAEETLGKTGPEVEAFLAREVALATEVLEEFQAAGTDPGPQLLGPAMKAAIRQTVRGLSLFDLKALLESRSASIPACMEELSVTEEAAREMAEFAHAEMAKRLVELEFSSGLPLWGKG